MRVIWMTSAEEQLEDIYNFLAQENIEAAVNIYNTIIEETDRLPVFREMAAKEAMPYRALVVNRTYKVVYRFNPDKEEVIIVAVWDCRRNPQHLKKSIRKRK